MKKRKRMHGKKAMLLCLAVLFLLAMTPVSAGAAAEEPPIEPGIVEEEQMLETNAEEVLVEAQYEDIVEVEALEAGADEPSANKATGNFDILDGDLTFTWLGSAWEYAQDAASGSVTGGTGIADAIEITQTNTGTATDYYIIIDANGAADATELYVKLNGVNIQVAAGTDAPFTIDRNASVYMLLEGDNKLDAGNTQVQAGLSLPSGNTLTIDGSGKLTAIGSQYGAGIGGTGNTSGVGGDCGVINIEGGTIEAYGRNSSDGYGAGIGGGGSYDGAGGSGVSIDINEGSVTARSSNGTHGYGAGIGGGSGDQGGGAGGDITINGGTVNAASGKGDHSYGAGMGGGYCDYNANNNFKGGSGGNIIINAGIVNASGSLEGTDALGPGIGGGGTYVKAGGGGVGGAAGNITINSGDIKAYGAVAGVPYSPGIGGGASNSGGQVGNITINGGNIQAAAIRSNLNNGAGIAGGGNCTQEGSVSSYEDVGNIIINGGNVQYNNIYKGYTVMRPKSSKTVNIYKVAITVNSPAVASGSVITGGSFDEVAFSDTPDAPNGVYGIKNVKTADGGKLYFWLPEYVDPVKLEAETGSKKYHHTGAITPDDMTEITLLPDIPPVTEYTVTFKFMDDKTADKIVRVNEGSTVAKPADPARENFVFAGWYMDDKYTAQYDFSKSVYSSFVLYAKWLLKPAVVEVSPEGDNKPLKGNIKIVFNKAMDKAGSVLLNGSEIKGEFTTSKTYTIPYDLKEYNKEYVVYASGFKDVDGLVAADYRFSFKTMPVPKVKNLKAVHPKYEVTDSYTLKWDAVPYADGYVLYGSGGKEIARLKTNSMKFTGLETGKKYAYRVMALAKKEKGALSDMLVTTPRPLRPQGMHYTSKTDSTVSVKWQPVKNVNYYRLFLNNEYVETVAASKNTYKFTDLQPNTKYNFKVAAVYRVKGVSVRGASASTKALTLD